MTEPSKQCKFLGMIIDSEKMIIELPHLKKDQLIQKITLCLSKENWKIREVASVIGLLIAACPAVPYGILYTKILEREKVLALLINDQDFEQKMTLSNSARADLLWWKDTIPTAFQKIRSLNYKKEIFSDASLTGWGASWNGNHTNGFWTASQRKLHINYLELIAAFHALRCFASDCSDCEILLRVDNTTALAYIRRMGGIQYPELNHLARSIWQWCEKRRIFVDAEYIPSRENVHADRESRSTSIDMEWELADVAFNKISKRWGSPEVDLFASTINTKVKKFCSWRPDPEAWLVDAFTVNWKNLRFYAFPPFSVILKTLKKIKDDKATGIVVVPYWPSQPWFPIFMKMLSGDPIFFNPSPDLLLSPCRSLEHPLAHHLSLVAGKLCA